MSEKTPCRLVFRALTLAGLERKRVHEVASLFMIVSNTGDDNVKISIEDDPLSECPVGYQYRERKDDTYFKHIDFYNPNVGVAVIEYILSVGLVQSSPTILELEGIFEQLAGDTTPDNWDTEKTIGVAQSQVLAVNLNRKGLNVQAKSTNTGKIYIGFDNTVLTTKWVAELQAGQAFMMDDYRGAIHAIASAADQLLGWGDW